MIPQEKIKFFIVSIRGQRVILDKEEVVANCDHPQKEVLRSQFATLKMVSQSAIPSLGTQNATTFVIPESFCRGS